MTPRGYVPVREIDHFVNGEVVDLPIDLEQQARVTLVLRPRTPHQTMREHLDSMAERLPRQRRYFTREEFANRYGATEEDLAVVAAFAGLHNLEVAEVGHARRRLVLKGKLGDLSTAFRVKFVHLHDPDHGVYRSHLRPVHVPTELKPVVQAVMGFSARAQHGHPAMPAPHVRRRLVDPRKVAQIYQFPAGCTGRGQTIGIIALGGGFHDSDLDAYFRHLGMRKPKISVVEIEGQENNPASPDAIRDCLARSGAAGLHRARGQSHPDRHVRRNSDKNVEWTLETTMDVELIGTWANGAHIVVYFTHNNARGKYEAFNAALHDKTYEPNVISCSWGAPEKLISHVLEEEMDLMFQAAALMGVTIVCASGDHGDGSVAAGQPQAYFPASSPHVLACGGTVLRHGPGKKSVEKVWHENVAGHIGESGYGESSVFKAPSWQTAAATASQHGGRVVPDVAAKADCAGGYELVVGGLHVAGCGTSAAAPLWASLAALLNEKMKTKVGYLTPLLYDPRCRAGIQPVGSSVAPWRPKVGLGTPRGDALLKALRK
ncbi:MAG: protease pro-enzyme activation domain-containing protein [Candidatus Korobacteraceae bacterium]